MIATLIQSELNRGSVPGSGVPSGSAPDMRVFRGESPPGNTRNFHTRPDHIEPQHWQEWLASGVDPDLIAANVRSLEATEAYDYLCYSDKLERLNTGRLASKWLNAYGHTEAGGWWCSGLDPLNDWEPMLWGTFKPNCPRRSFEPGKKAKPIKYEHPAKVPTRAFFLVVPDALAEQIYQRYEVTPTEEDRGQGFWFVAWKYGIPVVICEGVKKAGCLLTAGYCAIALPGIWNGYRKETQKLIAELQLFATPGASVPGGVLRAGQLARKVYLCFDHDQKPQTVKQVDLAIAKLGKLFGQAHLEVDRMDASTRHTSCQVRVIELPGPEKGVDDFIVAGGDFGKLYQRALTLNAWRVRQYTRLTYPAALTLNQRYLGELPIPKEAKLIGLKSPKNTGKTESLTPIVRSALRSGQWVLLIGHRRQLVQAICDRVGIDYITEVKDSETGKILGYGLCVDSLHPTSQALFSADGWHDGVVILDESEQVIWHTLNSSTEVKRYRVPVVREFKQLLENVLASDRGRVILSDADLSDLSIDFVKGLSRANVEPWIVCNTWKPKEPANVPGEDSSGHFAWTVHQYSDTTPIEWLAALEANIEAGGVPFIVTDSQKAKSRWSTKTLQARLQQCFPEKRILRIDSESVADPNHPAFGCVTQLNQVLQKYDIVIASPSIETGVSIDIKGHFTGVWGCLHGVLSVDSARQFLARVRVPVDRHLWVRTHGLSQVGNGSSSLKSLLASEHQQTKANLHLLQEASLFFDDQDSPNIDPTALAVWGKMACRINAGMVAYRQSVFDGLRDEGHKIVEAAGATVNTDALSDDLTQVRDQNYQSECAAISNSEELTDLQYEKLTQQRAKTPEERLRERKYKLSQRYEVPVDPELVAKDDDGWYSQIRLHYYMSVGKEYLKVRDRKAAESVAHQGKTWLPDFNKSQLGLAIGVLERLGIPELLDPEQEHRGTDELREQMAELARAHKWEIKAALGISIKDDDSPVLVAQKLLKKLGLKLSCIGRDRNSEGKAAGRVYQFVPGDDGRQPVFEAWLERDAVDQPVASEVGDSDPGSQPPDPGSVIKDINIPTLDRSDPGSQPPDPGSVIKDINIPTLDRSDPGSETPDPKLPFSEGGGGKGSRACSGADSLSPKLASLRGRASRHLRSDPRPRFDPSQEVDI